MFAYVGLGPGQEFIPYFLALLAFIWAAVIAVLQWPFMALVRLVRVRKSSPVVTQIEGAPSAQAVEHASNMPRTPATE